MSAELLREAATAMRGRAVNASQSGDGEPWYSVDDVHYSLVGSTVPCADKSDAEHIASWHPSIALMVADLLEALAHQPNWHEHDNCPDSDVKACCAAAARVLSRAYLGGAA